MKMKITAIILAAILALSLAACATDGGTNETTADSAKTTTASESADQVESESVSAQTETDDKSGDESDTASEAQTEALAANVTSYGLLDATEFFSERDMKQSADLDDAERITLADGKDVSITSEGVYVISGTASDATIVVEAGDSDKVQLVLDGVSITNADSPAIYVKSADKVFVTTTDSDNTLSVTGSFTADGTTNTDAVIFSRDDLVINGVGTLTISSTDNGISSKDDLKITGGTIAVSCSSDALEANDSIRIAGGSITISSKKDGLHAENEDDNSSGFIYICGGTLDVTASDDAIHATTAVQIDGGSITATAAECIEGTYIQINGGTLDLSASDDGINAARKSSAYNPTFEINDGYLKITMGQGDTDGIDSNGDLYINGGTVDITAQFPFDYDGTAEHNGGTIIVNGVETEEITNQFGGGGPGQMGGGGGNPGNFPGRGGMPNGGRPGNGEAPGELPPDGGENPGVAPEGELT